MAVYQTSPTLPLDYQELEYIETNGTQYIDTGVIPAADKAYIFRAKVTLESVNSNSFSIMGIGAGTGDVAPSGYRFIPYGFRTLSGANRFYFGYGTTSTECGNGHWTLGAVNNIESVLSSANRKLTVNGSVQLEETTAETLPEYNVSLKFPAYTYGGQPNSGYSTAGKIYSLCIDIDGKPARNFIPCYRKSDNVAGLFDTVNGVFYTNAGTGEFTKGAEVAQPQPIAEVVITDVKLNLTGGISETIKGEALTESQTNYSLAGGITKTIYNTEIKVDKQNQEITSVVSQLNQLSDSTAENFTQVNQTINNLTTTIQETGGGNIILNSVGYDTEPNGGGLVGWTNTGTVSSVTSPESISYGAVSGNEIDLGASSSITQRVTVDGSNAQKYSLSFKAKKSTVGQATVTLSNSIDNYVITLPAGTAYNWQSFDLTDFTASENYFDVTVATNSATTLFGITDLMLNVGNTTMQWVQASSEILNTQVAVTKNGVKVRSSVYDGDYVEITPLGFNGYSDASGSTQTVFTLNRDTTKVQKLRAENQIEMPPIKIVPITSGSNTGWAFVKMEDN